MVKGKFKVAISGICALLCSGCEFLSFTYTTEKPENHETGTIYEQSIANARKSFDYFSNTLKKSDGQNFRVKIAITKSDQDPEIIWVSKISQSRRGVFVGVLQTGSKILNKQSGASITIVRRQVVDWSFERKGRQYGSFTEVANGYKRTDIRTD